MEFVNKLFKYHYKYFIQGTEEEAVEYALLYVPKDASFNNNRSTLIKERFKKYTHEIMIETVEDLTILFF